MRVVTAALWLLAMSTSALAGQVARVQITATAINDQGDPVRGLQTGDVVLKDGGVKESVMDVEPATDPLSVAIVLSGFGPADAAGLSRAIGDAARALHQQNPATKIGIVEPGGATSLVVETEDAGQDGWRASLARIVATTPGQSFVDAVASGCQALGIAPADRRVVLGLVETHGAAPAAGADRLATTLAGDHVALWTIEAGAAGKAEWAPAVDKALTAATDMGGARRLRVKDAAAVAPGIARVIDFLTSQYVVTYGWPDPMLSQFSLVTRHDAGQILTPSWNR